jgi:uncharacterized protein YdhG (YjbR/CyaY superfamily)
MPSATAITAMMAARLARPNTIHSPIHPIANPTYIGLRTYRYHPTTTRFGGDNTGTAVIWSVLPYEAIETISYGMPTFKFKGSLIWYAAFSDHCSVFPTAAVINEFKSELKHFEISKGTIRIPLGQPLPASLLKKMVKKRLAQVEKK